MPAQRTIAALTLTRLTGGDPSLALRCRLRVLSLVSTVATAVVPTHTFETTDTKPAAGKSDAAAAIESNADVTIAPRPSILVVLVCLCLAVVLSFLNGNAWASPPKGGGRRAGPGGRALVRALAEGGGGELYRARAAGAASGPACRVDTARAKAKAQLDAPDPMLEPPPETPPEPRRPSLRATAQVDTAARAVARANPDALAKPTESPPEPTPASESRCPSRRRAHPAKPPCRAIARRCLQHAVASACGSSGQGLACSCCCSLTCVCVCAVRV